jgi:ankyrin repeat protein
MEAINEMIAPQIKPSGLEVDFGSNITALYSAITSCRWSDAVRAAEETPEEAKTWVVRRYDDEDGEDGENEIMWRFLPIHSACARQPPASVLTALLNAYPDGAKCVDDQGMYSLHYACGNQASREVIRMLLMQFPGAAKLRDPRGMLPIHYLSCWGPSSISVVDMILVANRDVGNVKDEDGNTPLDLAMEGEYDDHDAVVAALKRWMNNTTGASSSVISGAKSASGSVKSTMKVATNIDEKKESDALTSTPASPMVSPHTVGRLRNQINALQENQKTLDQNWEGKLNHQNQNYRSQINDLANQMKLLEMELSNGNNHICDLEDSLHRKDRELLEAYELIRMKDTLVQSANDERDGLSHTLADLTEQHDRYKKKSEILSDRLGSLNASLYTMMDQQRYVLDAMKEREDQWGSISELRREKMKELMALEEKEKDDKELETCLMKQTREMEAIQAVIAAVRQSEDGF